MPEPESSTLESSPSFAGNKSKWIQPCLMVVPLLVLFLSNLSFATTMGFIQDTIAGICTIGAEIPYADQICQHWKLLREMEKVSPLFNANEIPRYQNQQEKPVQVNFPIAVSPVPNAPIYVAAPPPYYQDHLISIGPGYPITTPIYVQPYDHVTFHNHGSHHHRLQYVQNDQVVQEIDLPPGTQNKVIVQARDENIQREFIYSDQSPESIVVDLIQTS